MLVTVVLDCCGVVVVDVWLLVVWPFAGAVGVAGAGVLEPAPDWPVGDAGAPVLWPDVVVLPEPGPGGPVVELWGGAPLVEFWGGVPLVDD